ncbi:hypothetical protein [Derxia lacustris]|uniref:hypothetical protein n=1 Tax=Derxia lacustris TaxID=764842 RepID=UPI00111C7936|nr:hypothetical protein [Derxia lacustris]
MLELLPAGKFLLDLIEKFAILIKNRILKERKLADPIRTQAQRVIDAFEAHDIPRQQIPYLLPNDQDIDMKFFSSADLLTEKINPRLIQFTAEILDLRREWLDGVDEHRHKSIHIYKRIDWATHWLKERRTVFNACSTLHIFIVQADDTLPHETGPILLVHEEALEPLHQLNISRYHLLSDIWDLEHPPCAETALALLALCETLGIPSMTHEVTIAQLESAANGSIFLSDAIKQAKHRFALNAEWVPLRYHANNLSNETHKTTWNNAVQLLKNAGIELPKYPK